MKESEKILLRTKCELAVDLVTKGAKLLKHDKKAEAQILFDVASDMVSVSKPSIPENQPSSQNTK